MGEGCDAVGLALQAHPGGFHLGVAVVGRCGVEELESLGEVLGDASTVLVHEAEDEHGVGVVLGDGLVEVIEGVLVVACDAYAFVVGASEDCFAGCVALVGEGLGVLDGLHVVAGLPLNGDGGVGGIAVDASSEVGICVGVDSGTKLGGAGWVFRAADACVEHDGEIAHCVTVFLGCGALEHGAGLGETAVGHLLRLGGDG